MPHLRSPGSAAVPARSLALWAAALVVLAVVGGALWAWWADPMTAEVTDIGPISGPEADEAGFSVVMVYCAIGAVLCGLWAAAAGWALRQLGWPLVPYVVLTTGCAALITWRVGSRLGPDDPDGLPTPQIGDRVQSMLELGSPAPGLVWPTAAVGAVLLVSWLDRPSRPTGSDSR